MPSSSSFSWKHSPLSTSHSLSSHLPCPKVVTNSDTIDAVDHGRDKTHTNLINDEQTFILTLLPVTHLPNL
jgi:hypothetical protein